MNNEILLETIIKDLNELAKGNFMHCPDDYSLLLHNLRQKAFEKMRFYQKMLHIINPNNEYGDIEGDD